MERLLFICIELQKMPSQMYAWLSHRHVKYDTPTLSKKDILCNGSLMLSKTFPQCQDVIIWLSQGSALWQYDNKLQHQTDTSWFRALWLKEAYTLNAHFFSHHSPTKCCHIFNFTTFPTWICQNPPQGQALRITYVGHKEAISWDCPIIS